MLHPDPQVEVPPKAHQPYPTYEALIAAQQSVRPAPNSCQLLFWPITGPLTSTISVMSRRASPDTLEPYYSQATDTWHHISQLPLTEPKVSSITVHVYELQEWEDAWCEAHREHSYPGAVDFEGVEWGVLKRRCEEDGSETCEDIEEKMNAEVGEEGGEKKTEIELLRCCGMPRPLRKDSSIAVKPALNGDASFVTVHDYLVAVHPWLMSLKEEILAAMETLYGDEESPRGEMELMVNCGTLDCLTVEMGKEWIGVVER